MFSLFEQNPTNMSYTFEMWLDANQSASEVPLSFQFMKSQAFFCHRHQLIHLKVSLMQYLK